MHDGKNELMKFIESIHPNQEISIQDMEPGHKHSLPSGFSVTDNPMSFSIVNPDPFRSILFGPMGDGGVALRVSERASGPFVKGIDLLVALARLLEVGPPTYQKSVEVLANWWKKEIAGCASFSVPEAPPQGKAEMEQHVETCETCIPVFASFVAAIDSGASIATESHLRTMIERSHSDQADAIAHYEQKRAVHSMTPMTAGKPSRRKTAVEVTA